MCLAVLRIVLVFDFHNFKNFYQIVLLNESKTNANFAQVPCQTLLMQIKAAINMIIPVDNSTHT